MRGISVALPPLALLLLVVGAISSVVLPVVRGDGVCNMTSKDFDACKPSVTATKPAPPTAACCGALAKADLPCLCTYKSSPMLPGLGIDPAVAAKLPPKCGLPMPSKCG